MTKQTTGSGGITGQLCKALREQYKDSKTYVYIREFISDRRQKPNENFDCFYESIIALTRLHCPMRF